MKLGMIICSNDAENVYNAFRLANFALLTGDRVRVFLMGKGVEADMVGADPFDTLEQMEKFLDDGGELYGCGSCMKLKNLGTTRTRPSSKIDDLHDIVKDCDKIIAY